MSRPVSFPFAAAGSLAVLLLLPIAAPACPDVPLGVEPVITGLTNPVRLVAPVGDERLFVVQQTGRVTVHDADGTLRGTFLDVDALTNGGGERGLLGLAFPPDYATTGRCYINYTDLAGDTRIARYTVRADDPDALDPATAEILLTIPQPASNHNGGHLEFGPDGMLYIGTGDGGSGGDPWNNAQNIDVLLGKLLRLDVSAPTGYTVPADNPRVGLPGDDRLWAWGLRNPWCFSFDRATGDLYIADVGQDLWEEVNAVPAAAGGGLNYGWRLMEGTHCYNPSDCDTAGLTLPIHEYGHGGSPFRCSISGGYVYRGTRIPDLAGTYFFADYCSNQLWTLRWTATGGSGPVSDCTAALTPAGGYGSLSGFGQDGQGELYILDHSRGTVHRIVPASSAVQPVPGPSGRLDAAPNPFQGRTELSYRVGRGGAPVTIDVHDLRGRLVRTLVSGSQAAGAGLIAWNGRDREGRRVPAGTYLCRLRQGGDTVVRKVMLVE